MERESFEDEAVAALLNASFVSIKVDREERPDIDHIYMTVCQALTGQGGWPLTVILTPDQMPIFAGTYFPKEARYGRPGLMDILNKVAHEWAERSDGLSAYGRDMMERVNKHLAADWNGSWSAESVDEAYEMFASRFDPAYGGFGQAPKFPSPHTLMFLLRYAHAHPGSDALDMVVKTLDAMAAGGIHDQIGGGFARYSTDEAWLVPHFEKMLYDNALLTMAYTEAYQVTRDEAYRRVVERIVSYISRDMTSTEGAFYSAEDADSEGEEGLFYLWTPAQVEGVLGEQDGAAYCADFDITEVGNFEGRNIPNRIDRYRDEPSTQANWDVWNAALLAARSKRVRPHRDDKVLTSWNALMIAALAKAGRVLEREDVVQQALRATEFLRSKLTDSSGRLLARHRDGESKYLGYVDDYAFLVWAMIELYEATFDPDHLEWALTLQRDMIERFWDVERGGFFYYPSDGERLVARPKEIYDGAMPSGNSVAALNLLRLGRMTGDAAWEGMADKQLRAFGKQVAEYPAGYAFYWMAVQFAAGSTRELVMVGRKDDTATTSAIATLQKRFDPNMVLLLVTPDAPGEKMRQLCEMVREFDPDSGKTMFYLCENFACQQPTSDFHTILSQL